MTARSPEDSVLVAVFMVLFVAFLAGLIWFLAMLWDESTPARTYHTVVTHSMRPTMSAREQVALATIKRGWDYEQLQCLVALINVENHDWSPTVKNSHSTASGLFQMINSPSGRVFSHYNLADQSRIGTAYIAGRYKNPCAAYAFERLHNYY